jgi:hypothetical protein
VKYFFLSEGWTIGRIWGIGGLWDVATQRRLPDLQKLDVCVSNDTDTEKMWLYRVEDEVLMLEVKPQWTEHPSTGIGQVVLTRLITADQVLDRLGIASTECRVQGGLF